VRATALLALLIVPTLPAASIDETPFRNNVNFYVVNTNDEPFKVKVLTDAQTEEPDRRGFASFLMIRAYGPEDQLLLAQEEQLKVEQRAEIKLEVSSAGAGVYVLMLTGGAPDWVGVKLEPALPYGVMGRTELTVRSGAMNKRFVYIPRNCREAQFKVAQRPPRGRRSIAVFDEANKHIGGSRSVKGFNTARLAPKVVDVVWRLEVHGKGAYSLNCAGLPGILCPNPDVAKQIKASAIYLEDVTLQHRWQVKMWEMLKAMKPEDIEVELPLLDAEALAEGGRRAALALGFYGPLSNVPLVLSEQNHDPAHHWFGSIRTWQAAQEREEPLDRWDSAPGPGYLSASGGAGVLAWVYGSDLPGNPYYKKRGLLHRAMAASFLQYLAMNEAEEIIEPGVRLSADGNWQRYHLRYLSDGPTVLHYLGDDVSAEARALWCEAIRHQAERLAYFHQWGTSDWSVAALGHYFTAAVTQEERCDELWRRHVECLLGDGMGGSQGLSAAGYFREHGRVDGGYNSMSSFYLGCLQQLSGETAILDALRRAWDLRAHLTLPEPDGKLSCPTSFNTRTVVGFPRSLYPDAALLAGVVERAGDQMRRQTLESPAITWNVRTREETAAVAEHWAANPVEHWVPGRVSGSFCIGGLLASVSSDLPLLEPVPLPAETQDSFARNFGNDLVCVRRPTYYAILYISPRGDVPATANVMQGGGLSALWTPSCGTVVLSVKDGPWFNHAITGVTEHGETVSSSFANQEVKCGGFVGAFAAAATTDTDVALPAEEDISIGGAATLTVTGEIPRTPLHYQRTYRFEEALISAETTVTARKDWACRALYEVIPYLLREDRRLETIDARTLSDAPREGAGFRIVAPSGHIEIEFGDLVKISVPEDRGKSADAEVGHVLVGLPERWHTGQTARLRCRIKPVTAARPPAAAE